MRRAGDDAELLEQWRRGDRVAADTLICRHVPALMRFFNARAGDNAADLVQATLEAVVRMDVGSREISSFRAYILGIARKQFLMWLRWRKTGDRLGAEGKLSSRPKSKTSPSQQLSRTERSELIRAALDELSLDHQITVQLYYWEEMTVAEIARVTEVSPGTVKSRLARARDRIEVSLRTLGLGHTG